MEDILALYELPLDAAEPVVCLDEKPVSRRADLRAPRPARQGYAAERDNENRCFGTANLFGVVEPKASRHFTRAMPNRSVAASARVMRRVIDAYPNTRTIHLVLYNLNTHRETAPLDHVRPVDVARIWARLTAHDTPKHGSW